MVYIWLWICLVLSITNGQESSVKWDVTIDQGTVRGYRSPNGAYYSFLGIPYATAPTGYYRFQAPLAAPSWVGVFESTYENILCPQTMVGEEHCLVMNVFAPISARTALLPVLVYIHGGAFMLGSGPTYGVGNLLDQGLVVVSFNYRLGALGFLCLGTEDVPGNAGLKDQVEALRWVNRNIAQFGGDPNSVTLYGTNAGGVSVELLILSNATNGLFHRAISESGSALAPWAIDRNPFQTARNLAETLGFQGSDELDILIDFYKRVPARYLAAQGSAYYNELTDATVGFAPCIEHPSPTAVLSESPLSILERGDYEPVPYITTFCHLEGFYRVPEFYDYDWNIKLEANFSAFLPADLWFDTEQERSAVAEEVKTFYFGQNAVSERTINAYIDYFGDITFFYGIAKSALLHAQNTNQIYLMEFVYEGRLNNDKKYFSYIPGAIHADLYPYAFHDFHLSLMSDSLTSERVTFFITNFVKFSDPTATTSAVYPEKWDPVQVDVSNYLSVASLVSMRQSPRDKQVQFWDRLYWTHYYPATRVQTGAS